MSANPTPSPDTDALAGELGLKTTAEERAMAVSFDMPSFDKLASLDIDTLLAALAIERAARVEAERNASEWHRVVEVMLTIAGLSPALGAAEAITEFRALLASRPATVPEVGAGGETLLAELSSVADDIFDRWDKDQRSGKLLSALAGYLKSYDPRVDRVRAALARPTEVASPARPAASEAGVTEAMVAGWNACRKSLYAVCEDVGEEYGKHRIDVDNPHRHHFGRGGIAAAQSIMRGFRAMEAQDDDNLRAALEAAARAAPRGDGEAIRKVCEPWTFHSGEPPADDSPLSGVFGAGMGYTERLLANLLGVKNYESGDGSEDFDSDATKTLENILTAAGLYDPEDGRWAALASAPAQGRSDGWEPRPLSDWHEEMGDVLWWQFPITEAPYVGSPLDLGQTVEIELRCNTGEFIHQHQVGGWPGYHTHFTVLPAPPTDPVGSSATRAGETI